MKKLAQGFYSLMKFVEEWVSMPMMFITIFLTFVNVITRYLLSYSIPWSQEVTGIAWTWTVMLGISWCYRRNMHMGVDFLIAKLKPSARRVMYIITFSILLIAMIFMLYMSCCITKEGFYKLTNYFKLPYAIKYVSAVIAFFNMTIYSVMFIVKAIKDPEDFLKRVALEGNGLDPFDEVEEIEGIPEGSGLSSDDMGMEVQRQ